MGNYSWGAYSTLPTDDTDLSNILDAAALSQIASDDTVRLAQPADGMISIIQFKDTITAGSATVRWNGQSNVAPSSAAVNLEIYNRSGTPAWESLASDNTTAADTDLTLSSYISDLTDYKNVNDIACRVYQAASVEGPTQGSPIIVVSSPADSPDSRGVHRTAGGDIYVWEIHSDGTDFHLRMYKLVTGLFVEQDSANHPAAITASYKHLSGAPNSLGTAGGIGVAYFSSNTQLAYINFDINSGTWANSGVPENVATITNTSGTETVSLDYDLNNVPHIAYGDAVANPTVYYVNKVGGVSWNTPVEIYGTTSSKEGRYPDLIVDSNNYPCITFTKYSDTLLSVAMANRNNPTDLATHFVVTDIQSGGTIYYGRSSIVQDSNNDHWVAYSHSYVYGGYYLKVAQHVNTDPLGTWQTPVEVDSTSFNREPSLVANGANLCIFCEKVTESGGSTTESLVLWKKVGGNWTRYVLETGAYSRIKARWYYRNNASYGNCDYIFMNGDSYVVYNYTTL